jgi:hypothetical protein
LSTKPTVSKILQDSGASAAELYSLIPSISKHTLNAISLGRTPGVTQAAKIADGLRALVEKRKAEAGRFGKAVAALERHYPVNPAALEVDPTMKERDAAIISLARVGQYSFAAIGRTCGGLDRERVRQIVEAYEQRTGEQLPRWGRS